MPELIIERVTQKTPLKYIDPTPKLLGNTLTCQESFVDDQNYITSKDSTEKKITRVEVIKIVEGDKNYHHVYWLVWDEEWKCSFVQY